MKTISVLIGNSDDKLSQVQWGLFVTAFREIIQKHATTIHFFGAPPNWEPRQNACAVISCPGEGISALKADITAIREEFGQDSAAWAEGTTEFI